MNHHKEKEGFHTPQVQAVEEVPDAIGMPPLGPKDGEDGARHDDNGEAGNRQSAEEIDRRPDIRGLFVWQDLVGRKILGEPLAHGERPVIGHHTPPSVCSAGWLET